MIPRRAERGSIVVERCASGNLALATKHDGPSGCALIRAGQVIVERADVRDLIDALTAMAGG